MKSHTGKIVHEDMVMYHGSRGHGKKDPHASAEHHAANKAHGMEEGLSPTGEELNEGGKQHGAPSESSNCEYT